VFPGVSLKSLLLELDALLIYDLLPCLLISLDSSLVCSVVINDFKFSCETILKCGNRTILWVNERGIYPIMQILPLGPGFLIKFT
jgi:hypothetical protein